MARKKYKEWIKQFPLVNCEKLGETWWRIPVYKGIASIFKALEIPEESRKGSVLVDLVGGWLDAKRTQYESRTEQMVNETFPKVNIWREFAEGPSHIDEMYTFEAWGREFPIYLKKANDADPTPQQLDEGRDFVLQHEQSPYNGPNSVVDTDKLSAFYNEGFDSLAVKKYMRGDLGEEKLEEPAVFKKWLVRDDMWLIQQFGEKTDQIVAGSGGPFAVKKYKRTSGLRSWWYWVVGDFYYDYFTMAYYGAQDYFADAYSPEGFKNKIEEKYKRVASGRRGFFNPRATHLAFEKAA